MRNDISIISTENLKDLSSELLMPNGKMRLLPADHYKQYRWDDFRSFCHFNGRYGIPTIELIDFIKGIIKDKKAIEIGAGAGDLGYHLGIKMTDSKLQERPQIKSLYNAMKQPIIKYPADVENKDALATVEKYKPDIVIGSWITTYAPYKSDFESCPFGIEEDKILEKVKAMLIIGNELIHGNKPIFKKGVTSFEFPWIVSRAKDQSKNRIYYMERL